MSPFLIYGLVDPRDSQLRYVGKSESGLRRPSKHKYPSVLAQDRNYHKVNWVRSLLAAGTTYDIKVLEECTSIPELDVAERRHIAEQRLAGASLLNLTDGGEGCRATPETRAKMSAAKLGRPRPEGLRKRLSEMALVRFADLAHREMASRAKGGRAVEDETGRRYVSASEAARQLGLRSANVWASARHGWRASGHTFRYAE